MPRTIDEAFQTPVAVEADVVVVGGGPAGIAAAIAAARTGSHTVLIERYGFLGGAGTAAGASCFCGLHAIVDGRPEQVVHGVVDEVLAGLERLDGLNAVHWVQHRIVSQSYDIAAYKCVADELVLAAGVDLRLHSLVVGGRLTGSRIDMVLLETKSGRIAVAGQVFVDCSGDGDLLAWSGAPYQKGDSHGFIQYPAMLYRIGNVDNERARSDGIPRLRDTMQAATRDERWNLPRSSGVVHPQRHHGEWRANVTQVMRGEQTLDGTNAEDLTFMEVEGRRQVQLYQRFLKASIPGFEDSYIVDIPAQIGVRETRRLAGEYVITGDDVITSRDFEDTIGVNGWPVERHTSSGVEWRFPEGRGYYQLPYRSLLPAGEVENLLVAGRCVSASDDAQAAVRVSGPCFVFGQAAGTAAALAVETGALPRAIDVKLLQRHLKSDGVFLGTIER